MPIRRRTTTSTKTGSSNRVKHSKTSKRKKSKVSSEIYDFMIGPFTYESYPNKHDVYIILNDGQFFKTILSQPEIVELYKKLNKKAPKEFRKPQIYPYFF